MRGLTKEKFVDESMICGSEIDLLAEVVLVEERRQAQFLPPLNMDLVTDTTSRRGSLLLWLDH